MVTLVRLQGWAGLLVILSYVSSAWSCGDLKLETSSSGSRNPQDFTYISVVSSNLNFHPYSLLRVVITNVFCTGNSSETFKTESTSFFCSGDHRIAWMSLTCIITIWKHLSWCFRCNTDSHHIECQNGWGWQGPLGPFGITPAQAGAPRARCPGPFPGSFWSSLRSPRFLYASG